MKLAWLPIGVGKQKATHRILTISASYLSCALPASPYTGSYLCTCWKRAHASHGKNESLALIRQNSKNLKNLKENLFSDFHTLYVLCA